MRISELCGLTLNDIDFDRKNIMLNKQIVYLSKKGYYFSTLKTKLSNRKILIDDFLTGELRRWKNQQAKGLNKTYA